MRGGAGGASNLKFRRINTKVEKREEGGGRRGKGQET